jgi:hypothetical protein
MGFFKRAERPDSGPPSDEKVAAQMRYLAQLFVDGMAAHGEVLAWDTASALRLDSLCEEFVTSKSGDETLPYLTAAMGAYLGELVVRNGRGRWVYSPEAKAPAVKLPSGPRCYPQHKVAKRLNVGREHNLWAFYDYMMTGKIAPDVKVTPREWSPPDS